MTDKSIDPVLETRALRDRFTGRLEDSVLADALSYVDFGESRLAFETLCDQLYEFEVPITEAEYQLMVGLSTALGAAEARVRPLEELIRALL